MGRPHKDGTPAAKPKRKVENVEVLSNVQKKMNCCDVQRKNREDLDNLPEGENTKYLSVIMATQEIAKGADHSDINAMYNCVNQYLAMLAHYDAKLTNTGIYAACNMSKELVRLWANGERRGRDPQFREFAINLRRLCGQYRENLLAEGKLNPVIGIWWQKNYDGYSDNPVDVNEDRRDDRLSSAENLADKYKDL